VSEPLDLLRTVYTDLSAVLSLLTVEEGWDDVTAARRGNR
jgi:hypothetical protein